MRWTVALDEQILSLDIEMLNEYAPEVISRIWKDLGEEHDLRGRTSTIYHFGLSERTGQYVGFAYRSAHGFVPDPIPHGFGVKRPWPSWTDSPRPRTCRTGFALVMAVRAEQDALALEDRIFVGGALTLTMLGDGVNVTSEIHRFDDFDKVCNEMNYNNLASGEISIRLRRDTGRPARPQREIGGRQPNRFGQVRRELGGWRALRSSGKATR